MAPFFIRTRSKTGSQSSALLGSPSSPVRVKSPPPSPRSPEQIWDEGVEKVRERERSRQSSRQDSREDPQHQHFLAPSLPRNSYDRYSDATIIDVISRYQNDSKHSLHAPMPPRSYPSSLRSTVKPLQSACSDDDLVKIVTPPPRNPRRLESSRHPDFSTSGKTSKSLATSRRIVSIPAQLSSQPAATNTTRPRPASIATAYTNSKASSKVEVKSPLTDKRAAGVFRLPEPTSVAFTDMFQDSVPKPEFSSNPRFDEGPDIATPIFPPAQQDSPRRGKKTIPRKPVPPLALKPKGSRKRNISLSSQMNVTPPLASPPTAHSGQDENVRSDTAYPPGSACSSERTWRSSSTATYTTTNPDMYGHMSTAIDQNLIKSAFEDDDDDEDDDDYDDDKPTLFGRLRRRKILSRGASRRGSEDTIMDDNGSTTLARVPATELIKDRRRRSKRGSLLCGCWSAN